MTNLERWIADIVKYREAIALKTEAGRALAHFGLRFCLCPCGDNFLCNDLAGHQGRCSFYAKRW